MNCGEKEKRYIGKRSNVYVSMNDMLMMLIACIECIFFVVFLSFTKKKKERKKMIPFFC